MCYVACVYLLHCNVASCRLAVVVARRTRRGLRNPFEWPRSRISSGDMLSGEKFTRQERKYRIAIRLSSSTICIVAQYQNCPEGDASAVGVLRFFRLLENRNSLKFEWLKCKTNCINEIQTELPFHWCIVYVKKNLLSWRNSCPKSHLSYNF